jgi:hypothetical protein
MNKIFEIYTRLRYQNNYIRIYIGGGMGEPGFPIKVKRKCSVSKIM